jgi:hypothetical protein
VPLSSRELDALADDLYKDRRISGPVYCGGCGYNLKTLPYVYTCPECGQSYNARPRIMKGIFMPYTAEWPFLDLAAATVCAFVAGYLFWNGLPAMSGLGILLGAVMATLALAFLNRFLSRYHQFRVASKIAARIEEELREG